jgi:signal transduction histidine kinase
LNPRNWTLVWKLAVVGLLPAVLALVLGVLRVADQAGDAAELGRSTRLLEVQQQVSEAANAMRTERDESTLFVAEQRGGDRGALEIDFGKTDAEISEMLNTVRGASELDPTTVSALQQTESSLAELPTLRTDTTDNQATGINQVRGRYTTMVESVDVLDRALLRQLRTPDTAGLADALTAATSVSEQLAIQHTVLGTGIRAGKLQPGDVTAVTATENQISADYREYQVALTPDQLTKFGSFLDDAANSQRQRLQESLLATPADRPITLQPTEWDTAYNGSRAAVDRSAGLLRTELVNDSTAAEQAASNEAGIQSVILMLGLLAGITVAVLVARALIRSLRVLRTAALDVAERRLPQAVESMRAGESPDITVDPVPISGRDEVGQVARAFDAVHGQAVRLAAEQAALQSNVSAMFVNLSRRSQALVERQLQLIEQLESNEQDPDQLSNLFQLDHLATRMRRNSENLLVLAGTDLAKRNASPIPLVDVLRAAVSEVEQYQRIVVQSPPTATIAGRAGADLVHLLAELLDNATNFSPPESQVVMSSTRTSDGSVLVEISDRGVGMLDHELTEANQRLGGPSTVDVSASRRMGLFVVGRLGARHGISVRLGSAGGGNGQPGGLTASVTVPAYLISAAPGEQGRQFGGQQQAPAGPNGLPQRIGHNGVSSTNGSLSALVAGTDGPANPTSVFDPQVQEGGAALGGPPPAANGSPLLPTRRPGSTLRPNRDGPPLPPSPTRSEPGPAEQPNGDDRAREIAEQARRDQEAAARRTAAQRQNPARQDTPSFPPGAGLDQQRGAFYQNGNGNGATPGEFPATGPQRPGQAPERQPQARTDTGRRDEEMRPDDRRGPGTDPGGERGFPGNPLPRRVPGTSAQPPSRPARETGDDGAPRTLHPSEPRNQPEARNQPDQRPQPTDWPPALPQRSTDRPQMDRSQPDRPQVDRPQVDRPQVDRPQVDRPQGERPAAERPQQLPELPQRVPASDLPRREPRTGPQGAPPPFSAPDRPSAPQGGQPPTDALFAPVVPAEPQPEGPPSGRRPSAQPERRFDPTETTPIFEEIASAWFRSNRQIPVSYEADDSPAQATPDRPGTDRPAPSATPTGSTAPASAPMPTSRPSPVEQPGRPAPSPAPAPEPQPVGAVAGRPDRGFATEADEGWRAASGAVADRAGELTTAGLPKRRPRARLVPGSAGSAVLAAPASPARSAENIRGRLASYQQGVRQGREQRLRGETAATPNGSGSIGGNDPANAGGNHDEESS